MRTPPVEEPVTSTGTSLAATTTLSDTNHNNTTQSEGRSSSDKTTSATSTSTTTSSSSPPPSSLPSTSSGHPLPSLPQTSQRPHQTQSGSQTSPQHHRQEQQSIPVTGNNEDTKRNIAAQTGNMVRYALDPVPGDRPLSARRELNRNLTIAPVGSCPPQTQDSSMTRPPEGLKKRMKLNARVPIPDPPFQKRTGSKRYNMGNQMPQQHRTTVSSPLAERPRPLSQVKDGHRPLPAPKLSSYPFPAAYATSKSSSKPWEGKVPAGPEIFERPMSSGTPTPASFNPSPFLPRGPQSDPADSPDSAEFPTPNLYDLSLMLNSEPGLEGFWSNLVQICTTCYKVERMSLSVPTDTTDLENTPWGQKATFNMSEDDHLSLTYMGEGGIHDLDTTSESEDDDDDEGVPLRADERGITIGGESYTEAKGPSSTTGETASTSGDINLVGELEEPFTPVTVAVPAHPSPERNPIDLKTPIEPPAFSLNDTDRAPFNMFPSLPARKKTFGRVFPKLQPLSYEADALLDGAGVTRILQRGKVVVLSREYRERVDSADSNEVPELPAEKKSEISPERPSQDALLLKPKEQNSPESNAGSLPSSYISQPPTPLEFVGRKLRGKSRDARRPKSAGGNHSPMFPYYSSHHHQQRHSRNNQFPSSNYEEYEQCVTSPWSQSPAPSPAIKRDPNENPFFTLPKVDEASFSPEESTPEYVPQAPVPAIGLESAWTVIHIPLIHPSIYKVLDPFGQGAVQKKGGKALRDMASGFISSPRFLDPTESTPLMPNLPFTERKAPLAILSILSPAIPYPRNLTHSLKNFAPIIATAFALAQSHTAVVTQLEHLRQKRLARLDFSTFGAGLEEAQSAWDDTSSATSATESTTASHYVSARNSRLTSPTLKHGSDFFLAPTNEGSYEEAGLQYTSPEPIKGPAALELATGQSTSSTSTYTANTFLPRPPSFWPFSRQNSSENAPTTSNTSGNGSLAGGRGILLNPDQHKKRESLDALLKRAADKLKLEKDIEDAFTGGKDREKGGMSSADTIVVPDESGPKTAGIETRKRYRSGKRRRGRKTKKDEPSAILHSHGADYSSTFQTLAPTTAVDSSHSRKGSVAPDSTVVMPPPSNRLLRTIIDSIPVHVFTAEPQTGRTTWVNARFLAYRGTTAEEILKTPWDGLHPDDLEEHMQRWRSAVQKGESLSHQIRIRRFDGVYRWFMTRAVPLRDSKGGIAHWFGTNMDVHDQWVAEVNAARQAEIAESESKYRTLANSSPQIVFAATADEGITFANNQWLEYSGQTLEESLHLGFMEHVHPAERHKCGLPGLGTTVRFDEITTDGKGVYATEVRLRDKHGEYRWHLVRCVSVDSSFGTGKGMWFGTCTDINDHKLLEQKLKEANEAAQKTMESKTRFLANMSHEIRTPLIGISGMVNFLLDTQLTVEQLDYCHTISSSSDGLLTVINDILDLSKVEAGMMRLNFEWFRIHGVIEDANELLSTMAIAKNIELNFVVEEDVPAIVCGDRVRLRQVLLNVIGNAIKFTQKGEVFSRCSVVPDADVEPEEIMLKFECHDTGPGFDKKEEEFMFKPFSQIDGSSTRGHGGSGLGLVISRQLVELHGGTMTAHSEKGKGATFVCTAKFRLPTSDGPLNVLSRSPSQVDFDKLQEETSKDAQFPRALDSTIAESPPSVRYNNNTGSPFTEETARRIEEEPSPDAPGVGSGDSGVNEEDRYAVSAARPDPATMRLALPTDVQQRMLAYRPPFTPSAASSVSKQSSLDIELGRAVTPPMFSILIVAEHHYSRLATAHHIKMTLPSNIPAQITLASEFSECVQLISGEDPIVFTHIVLNLPEPTEIIELISRIFRSSIHSMTSLVILTNAMQRTSIIEGISPQYKKFEDHIHFIYKPIKPSRFGAIFDPARQRDASTDRHRDTAQQVAENQKRVFSDMEKEVGGKGHKVLLVEDNKVNQKVLLRFLNRAALGVDTANDGIECVEKIKAGESYDLILCDLHMPRKDGFQACSEIRAWEKENNKPQTPIVALSANVMSDVQERCMAAGFTRYVTKPVDFRFLGEVIRDLLNGNGSGVIGQLNGSETGTSAGLKRALAEEAARRKQ